MLLKTILNRRQQVLSQLKQTQKKGIKALQKSKFKREFLKNIGILLVDLIILDNFTFKEVKALGYSFKDFQAAKKRFFLDHLALQSQEYVRVSDDFEWEQLTAEDLKLIGF